MHNNVLRREKCLQNECFDDPDRRAHSEWFVLHTDSSSVHVAEQGAEGTDLQDYDNF